MSSPTSPPHSSVNGNAAATPVDPDVDGVMTSAGPGASAPADTEEVARLRAELAVLRSQLGTRRRRADAVTAVRRVAAAVLIAITAFALVASVVGLWAATTILNTDRWVSTVAPLPQDPQVAAAVAEYATNEIFQVVDVEQRLRTVLPEQAAFVAGPLAGQVRTRVENTVYDVLRSDRFQVIWTELNRRVHQRAMAVIDGTSTVVTAGEDYVDIDLLPLINQVLRELSTQLPTLFGKQLSLPDLSSGQIPENLRARVQDALGVTLPANFAQFRVYDAGQLKTVQAAVVTAKRGLAILVVGTIALLGLALLVSPRRRRTVLQLGVWLVLAAVTVTAVLRAVRSQVLEQVPAGTYRDGVAAALTTVTSLLRDRGQQLIWIGVILALLAYLVGPGRVPVWLRAQAVRAGRGAGRWTRRAGRAAATSGPGWTARHLDAIRIAGVVVAAGLALVLSSWTSLLVILVALAVFEVGVTVIARSATPASGPPAGLSSPQVPPAHPGPS
jgi:hypothetical protein